MTRPTERRATVTEPDSSASPLMIGLYGPSGSGKTFSALRMATGIRNVVGGGIVVLDTESRRANHYKSYFDFKHVDFEPPFGPLDYLAMIRDCEARHGNIIVVDSMTHEHSGEGGYLDLVMTFAGGSKKKEKDGYARYKPERKRLNRGLIEMGRRGTVLILCYRGNMKLDYNDNMKKLGVVPESTSDLIYDMTACLLLRPGLDGTPTIRAEGEEERLRVKIPVQFRDWGIGQREITEELGEQLALWSIGGRRDPATPAAPAEPPSPRPATPQNEGYAAYLAFLDKNAVPEDKRRHVGLHVLDWAVKYGHVDPPTQQTVGQVNSRIGRAFSEHRDETVEQILGFLELMNTPEGGEDA